MSETERHGDTRAAAAVSAIVWHCVVDQNDTAAATAAAADVDGGHPPARYTLLRKQSTVWFDSLNYVLPFYSANAFCCAIDECSWEVDTEPTVSR